MADIIAVNDLPSAIQSVDTVELMVAGANARAARVAPCLAGESGDEPTEDQLAEAKLVLVGAVVRWAQAGAGALQSQSAGPFSQTVDTRQRTGYNLWPSEIEQLQAICASEDASTSAFSITPTTANGPHMPWCTLLMGGTYCSCGADLTNYAYPLFEGGVLSDDSVW